MILWGGGGAVLWFGFFKKTKQAAPHYIPIKVIEVTGGNVGQAKEVWGKGPEKFL